MEAASKSGAPWWTVAYFNGGRQLADRHDGRVSMPPSPTSGASSIPRNSRRERGFDFTKDYVVINKLGGALFMPARRQRGKQRRFARSLPSGSDRAIRADAESGSENLAAHYGLRQCFRLLGVRMPKVHLPDKPAKRTRRRCKNGLRPCWTRGRISQRLKARRPVGAGRHAVGTEPVLATSRNVRVSRCCWPRSSRISVGRTTPI